MRKLFLVGDSNINSLRGQIDSKHDLVARLFSEVYYLPTNPFIRQESSAGINPVDRYLSGEAYSFEFQDHESHPHLRKLYDYYYTSDVLDKLTKNKLTAEDVVLHVGREFGAGARLLGRYGAVAMERMPERELVGYEKRFQGLRYLPRYPMLPIVTGIPGAQVNPELALEFGVVTSALTQELYENLAQNLKKKVSGYVPQLQLLEAPPPSDKVARIFWGDAFVDSVAFKFHLGTFRQSFLTVFQSAAEYGSQLNLCFADECYINKCGFVLDEYSLDIPDLHVKPDYFEMAVSRILSALH